MGRVRLFVSESEARIINALDDLGIDTDALADALATAIRDGRKHPLTIAASHVESSSFQTAVERGDEPPPAASF